MKIGEPHSVVRRKPANLLEKDAFIFKDVLSYEVPAPEILQIKTAQVLKELVFDPHRLSFATDYTHLVRPPLGKRAKRLLWLAKPAEKMERGIWIAHEWTAEYFHWLMDALCRVMIVPDSLHGFPLLLPDHYQNRPYISASLDLLGIAYRFYPTRKRVQVGQLMLPGHVALTGNYNEGIVRRLRDRFWAKGPALARPGRKIYVSRKMAARRHLLNEPEVAGIFQAFGYEIHYFERYSFSEQIHLMQQAKVIAGLHGAGLTNMLFMPEGGHVLELRSPADIKNNCYFALASALGHSYFYLFGSLPENNHDQGNITVNTEQLQQTLSHLASFML